MSADESEWAHHQVTMGSPGVHPPGGNVSGNCFEHKQYVLTSTTNGSKTKKSKKMKYSPVVWT